VSGFTIRNVAHAVVVRDRFPQSVAHELGHTYGLPDRYDPSTFACVGNDATSHFAYSTRNLTFLGTDFDNYMCGAPSRTHFIREIVRTVGPLLSTGPL
jgi:hypothetical protein